MSTPKFKKAKQWIGKDLTLHVGGGDRKINDRDILEGPQWARFGGMGFLQEVKEPAAAPVAKTSPATPPAPAAPPSPPSTPDGTTTKSHAGKLSAQGAKTKTKGKPAESEKPAEVAATTEKPEESKPAEGDAEKADPGPGASEETDSAPKE
jgi:hypothetical protein